MKKLLNIFKKKDKVEEPEEELTFGNDPQMLFVQFLFKEKPVLNNAFITEELKKHFKEVDAAPAGELENFILHFFPEYQIQLKDGVLPAQGAIFVNENQTIDHTNFKTALQQIWDWPQANETLNECRYEFMASDFMSLVLDYKERVEFHEKFITALVAVTKPNALYFKASDKLVDPQEYLDNRITPPEQKLYGTLNIRMFNIADGAEGEMLMDTVGLHALGLADFQVRFKDVDPSVMAQLLHNYAIYIYENGVVIEDGDTVQGATEQEKWKCNYQPASLQPERAVINVTIL